MISQTSRTLSDKIRPLGLMMYAHAHVVFPQKWRLLRHVRSSGLIYFASVPGVVNTETLQ